MFIHYKSIPMQASVTPLSPTVSSRPESARRIHKFRYLALAATSAALLAACGGGGGPSAPAGPVASTLSFPLQSAYAAAVATGFSRSFTVSGTCSGTATEARSAASGGASFEGATGLLSTAETLSINFSNCTPASSAATATSYYDSNYTLLGTSIVGSLYRVYSPGISIPTSVTVGSTGTLGTSTNYSSSSKASVLGQSTLSYVVEPDTATTAIVNLIARTYDSGGHLTSTEQDRYRIATTGPAVPLSADVQYAYTSSTHLVLQ